MLEPRHCPEEIQKRLRTWDRLARQASFFDFAIGTIQFAGPVISAALTAISKTFGGICSVLIAICAGLMWRSRPELAKVAYRRAWRILDNARLKYIWGLEELPYLIDECSRAERVIEKMQLSLMPRSRPSGHKNYVASASLSRRSHLSN